MPLPYRTGFRALPAVLLGLALLGIPASVSADSGGYRRPSVSSSAAPAARSSNAPSSGGYRRPSAASGGYATGSGGDVAVSRGASGQALQQYRAAQQPRRPPPSTAEPSGGSSGWNTSSGWNPQYQRRPPAAAAGWDSGGSGFGSAAFWAFIGALSAADRSAYFRQVPG